MTIDQRVEKHVIKPNNKYYSLIKHYCHMSKNLYNHGNYLVRQSFCKEEDSKYLAYYDIEKLTKQDKGYPDYRMMPSAQSAQNTLRLLDQNWKSFFASIKDFKKHADKYLGRPKLPKYLKKDSEYLFFFTYQEVRLKKDNLLHFPRTLQDFTLRPKCIYEDDFNKIKQVRFLPRRNKIEIEVVYIISLQEPKQDNNKYLGIDIGVDNLATCVTSDNSQDFIVNGRPLKSMNQYYNKKSSNVKSILKLRNNKHYSNQLDNLTCKRNNKVNDYLHKASRYIVNYCTSHNINTIIIGTNKQWKQKCNIGKNNQTFIQIPFAKLVDQIMYKAKELGVTVIKTEESYTSGTSYLDNELPTKEFYNKSRRIKRGLFRSNSGTLINADQNAAYQIIKKEIPITWDRGEVLSPFLVNLC